MCRFNQSLRLFPQINQEGRERGSSAGNSFTSRYSSAISISWSLKVPISVLIKDGAWMTSSDWGADFWMATVQMGSLTTGRI